MRLHSQLIEQIEHKGYKFVPIYKLAELAFNYKPEVIQKEIKSIGVSHFKSCSLYFYTEIAKRTLCSLTINHNFDMYKTFKIPNHDERSTHVSNQAQIYNLLREWEFT